MPRQRNKENRGVPKGWRWKHDAWRYRVPPAQKSQWDNLGEFKLGKTLPEAYATWTQRLGYDVRQTKVNKTIGDLLQRYYTEVSSKKPPQSLKSDTRCYKELLKVFSDVPLDQITPQDIYKYIDKRIAKVAARREISMLSHAFTKAVQWGYIKEHPFKGELRLENEKTKDQRYVEDWEIDQLMTLQPKRQKGDLTRFMQAFVKLNLIIGVRKANMLKINLNSLTDEGMPIDLVKKRKKTTVIFTWTPALKAAVAECKAARPVDISPWLFCTRRGESYFNEKTGEASGFDSNWDRFMDRVLAETKVKTRFTIHDLRGKAGSDAPTDERAREALTHDDVKVTRDHYRRKIARIVPLK